MMQRINEHDEFLLSRLLDNDLSPAEAEALRRRIEAEPALARAYAHMARLDNLLKARRADQPRLDWKGFHARVTSQVERAAEAKASRPVIRLSRWLAIGLPLAAAAAIALVVILRAPADKTETGPDNLKPGRLVVQVDEPAPVAPAGEGDIKIRFKRSQQLAELTWQADAEAEEQPASHVFVSLEPEVVPLSFGEFLIAELPM